MNCQNLVTKPQSSMIRLRLCTQQSRWPSTIRDFGHRLIFPPAGLSLWLVCQPDFLVWWTWFWVIVCSWVYHTNPSQSASKSNTVRWGFVDHLLSWLISLSGSPFNPNKGSTSSCDCPCMPDSSGFHHEYPMLEHTKIYNNMIQHGNTAMQVTKCNSTILGRVHTLYNHTEPLELRGCRFENQWVNTGMDLKYTVHAFLAIPRCFPCHPKIGTGQKYRIIRVLWGLHRILLNKWVVQPSTIPYNKPKWGIVFCWVYHNKTVLHNRSNLDKAGCPNNMNLIVQNWLLLPPFHPCARVQILGMDRVHKLAKN